MPSAQSQLSVTPFPTNDDHDSHVQEPQLSRVHSHHVHYQAVPVASMTNGPVWQQRQSGNTPSGSPAQFSPAYNDPSGGHGLHQLPNRANNSGVSSPYIVQYAYHRPAMQHHSFSAGSPFGPMHAGPTDAGEGNSLDHSQTHYQSAIDPALLQMHPNNQAFAPGQPTSSPYNNHNFMDNNQFIGTPSPISSPPRQHSQAAELAGSAGTAASFTNGHSYYVHGYGQNTDGNPHPVPDHEIRVPQHDPQSDDDDDDSDMDPPSPSPGTANNFNPNNPNGWTKEQEDLIRELKHRGAKVRDIVDELRDRFGVEKTENAVSKRWKIIKKRDSRDVS